MTKYEKQARMIYDCNFQVYGIGNFDISIDELAVILKLSDKGKIDELDIFYGKLLERLG